MSELGGWGAGGAAKDFVVSRTFYSVSSGWRLLSASQRTNSSSPSSSSLPIPLSSGPSPSPSPFPSPFPPYPFLTLRTLLSKHSVISSSPLLRVNLTLENFPLVKIFISFPTFASRSSTKGQRIVSSKIVP